MPKSEKVNAAPKMGEASVLHGKDKKEPVPLNAEVSKRMKRVKRVGTGPEKKVRAILFHKGLRYRINLEQLPGKPDIAFTKARIAVFIDGCYWHGCPIHGAIPKNNRTWWEEKFERNRARDRRVDATLEALGWIPLRYWEHDDPEEVAEEIEWVWRTRQG